MRILIYIGILGFMLSGSKLPKSNELQDREQLEAILDTVRETEQTPIRLRDSLMKIYGADSKQVREQQEIYEKNHLVNEAKITGILDTYGWPARAMIGEKGNLTICNVIQHSDNAVRLKYLPMMRQAVTEHKLEPRFLGRAEDRIATERGDLQIYGTQIKYDPETKTFNLWPVYDPVHIDERRSAIGLEPIDEFLRNRFDLEWNLNEQIERTNEFKKKRNTQGIDEPVTIQLNIQSRLKSSVY